MCKHLCAFQAFALWKIAGAGKYFKTKRAAAKFLIQANLAIAIAIFAKQTKRNGSKEWSSFRTIPAAFYISYNHFQSHWQSQGQVRVHRVGHGRKLQWEIQRLHTLFHFSNSFSLLFDCLFWLENDKMFHIFHPLCDFIKSPTLLHTSHYHTIIHLVLFYMSTF